MDFFDFFTQNGLFLLLGLVLVIIVIVNKLRRRK